MLERLVHDEARRGGMATQITIFWGETATGELYFRSMLCTQNFCHRQCTIAQGKFQVHQPLDCCRANRRGLCTCIEVHAERLARCTVYIQELGKKNPPRRKSCAQFPRLSAPSARDVFGHLVATVYTEHTSGT